MYADLPQRMPHGCGIHLSGFSAGGGIRKAYSHSELITHSVDVRMAGNCAIVLFAYSTDRTLRGSGEPFGIAGLEAQVCIREDDGWKLTHVHYSTDKQQNAKGEIHRDGTGLHLFDHL